MSAECEHATWADVLARVIDSAHLAVADQLVARIDEAVALLGLTADVLLVDLAQRAMTSLGTGGGYQVDVTGTMAGRCHQLGEILPATDAENRRVLWVPMLDGTDRLGVLRIGLDERGAPVEDDTELRRWLWTLAGLAGHIVATKIIYSDRLRRWRSNGPLTAASELLWQLLPPLTFATERVVVSAMLEPYEQVAGDAFDYNVDGDVVDLAVFDAAGHDLQACITTALAITGIRNARRAGEKDLVAIAAHADELIAALPGPRQFATAVIARLDTATGILEYVIAGHPAPLLVRRGKVVKELEATPRLALGLTHLHDAPTDTVVAREQLEPGDQILFYTDGVVEARDEHGEFFGEERLVEFTERASAAGLSAPEVLRRLSAAVLDHQRGHLQDDATLLLAEWSPDAFRRMYPAAAVDAHVPSAPVR